MPQPIDASLAPALVLSPGWTINVVAVDPNTGATVSGVLISNVSLTVADADGSAVGALDAQSLGEWAYVPGAGA